ncbi:MAG: nucleoside-diphosphate kinase [Verrucomicrobia bacterium]|nr:nucleoside-diphosphate kinase [Verrucomicrobiota bacterium]
MQRTLILLKPDAIDRGLAGAILARFEAAKLCIEKCRSVRPSLEQLEAHYADLKPRNERAFRRTTASLQGKLFIAVLLSGPNAIQKVRALTGPTDPLAAPAGTVRGDFGNDTIDQADAENRAADNLVHAADSVASVEREMAIWFGEE